MALVAENLEVIAGPHVLLRDFRLHLKPGEVVTVTGASGVGKSTLLEALAYLRSGEPGRLLLDGKDPRTWGVPLFRRRVMFVSGRPAFPNVTIGEVLRRPLTYACDPHPFDQEAACAMLFELGIEPSLQSPAHTLSAGEAQRLALVRALLLKPRFCLLDEPTSALDPEHRTRAHRLLQDRLERFALGIVLVSHDPNERDLFGARVVAPQWIREPRGARKTR